MAKRRVYRPSSPIRYKWKLFRIYGSFLPESLALEFVDTMAREWGVGFGEYHKAWEDLLKSGVIPAGTPRMDLAKWKAALCYVINKAKKGLKLDEGTPDRAAVENYLTKVIGLSSDNAKSLVNFVIKSEII
jgi:hypothetical protein